MSMIYAKSQLDQMLETKKRDNLEELVYNERTLSTQNRWELLKYLKFLHSKATKGNWAFKKLEDIGIDGDYSVNDYKDNNEKYVEDN